MLNQIQKPWGSYNILSLCCVFFMQNSAVCMYKMEFTTAAMRKTYFWPLTEATRKCAFPSLYCFLCDLTRVPLQFRTTAPFSREMMNSSAWSLEKIRFQNFYTSIYNRERVCYSPWFERPLPAEHRRNWSFPIAMGLPLRCGRRGVRWAAVSWSWVLLQSCWKERSLQWIPSIHFHWKQLYVTSVMRQLYFEC